MFIECSLCARHCYKKFPWVNSFNVPSDGLHYIDSITVFILLFGQLSIDKLSNLDQHYSS